MLMVLAYGACSPFELACGGGLPRFLLRICCVSCMPLPPPHAKGVQVTQAHAVILGLQGRGRPKKLDCWMAKLKPTQGMNGRLATRPAPYLSPEKTKCKRIEDTARHSMAEEVISDPFRSVLDTCCHSLSSKTDRREVLRSKTTLTVELASS